ncbi:MAG: leucyl aminopeptidase [Aggregatilineales bacterium]
MDIVVSASQLRDASVEALVVFMFENEPLQGAVRELDDALGGAIQDVIAAGDITGKAEQVVVLYPRGAVPARRVVMVGLGEKGKFTVECARRAAAQGLRKARELKAKTAATALPDSALSLPEAAEALAEGALLGLYSYHGQKSKQSDVPMPESLLLVVASEEDVAAAESGIRTGVVLAEATCLARDLVNLPPNVCTPAHLGEVAKKIGEETGLKVEVLERRQIEALNMGALLGVAQGSETPPRFIILEHNALRADDLPTIVLVGKGITFDTGGYSIKSAENMVGMKSDMAGAAAVLGAMSAIGKLDVPLHVIGLAPAVENMISGRAYRPQDVLTASNGMTIEVISTDAEGRLVLADALAFASRYKPAAVVDIATLTGACVVALGAAAAGLFCTDDQLRDKVLAAAEYTGERVWPLPLFAEYDKLIESQTADIKNSGGRYAGAATAAAFLRHFVDCPAWAHLDIAGMVGIEGMPAAGNDNPYIPAKGATGYGARLLTDLLRRWEG